MEELTVDDFPKCLRCGGSEVDAAGMIRQHTAIECTLFLGMQVWNLQQRVDKVEKALQKGELNE